MAIEDQRNVKQPQTGGAAQRLGGVAPYVNHRAPNGPPVMPDAPQLGNGVKPSTALNATYRPNFTMGGGADSTINTTAKVVPDAPAATDVRAKYNPANGSPEAKAWQAQRAAASTPTATPATPTAAPAATPQGPAYRAGAAAGRLASPVLKAAGAVAAPAALAGTASTVWDTPTSDYETRFGFGPNKHEGVAGLARDIGVRSLGAASDLGDAMTLGLAGKHFYADKQNPPAAVPQAAAERLSAQPSQQTPAQAPGAPEQTAAAALPNAQAAVPQDWNRQGMTNALVAQANPQGRVQVERQANGTTAFSGGNVSGPVSYTNGAGVSVPGAGINGQGFGGFESAPAGANVGIGAGGYGFESRDAGSTQAGAKPRESWGDFTNRMVAMERGRGTGAVPQMGRPTTAHSGNDWNVRQRLRSLGVAASSITGTARERGHAQSTYQQAQLADLAAMTGQSGLDARAMEANAGLQREGMGQEGANTRAAMGERSAAQRLAMEGRRLAGEEETRGFQSRHAQRLEDAQEAYLDAKTDEARGTARNRLAALTGKSEERNLSNNFMKRKVPTLDKEGRVVGEQEELVDLRTGTPLGGERTVPTERQVGSTSTVNGATAVWDGSKWVPRD